MTGALYPRLADVFPALATEIAELLRAEGEPLAGAVAGLPYHGPCTCTATCINLLTAPPGSSGSSVIQLERDGMDVIWLSLDPSRTTITDIEVLDGRDLRPSASGLVNHVPSTVRPTSERRGADHMMASNDAANVIILASGHTPRPSR
ncbi:hypothetical protein [Streptomyces nodosus]|uniref:hypothetical protein n=1 Tax=Streptomyces nodosus TaxID=40318 RepID=UPI001184A604|nr:hypothetical protein [Streptomyces nodosus]MBB4789684.1 hypothetical protein [Streptomyces nodosus]